MFCTQCGQKIADTSQFCQYCGARLAGAAVPPNVGLSFWEHMKTVGLANLTLISIVTTIVFFPLGAGALFFTLASKHFEDQGDSVKARQYANVALIWNVVTWVVETFLLITFFIVAFGILEYGVFDWI